MPEQQLPIAMFSGPRNISTTMMRSFGSRPDTDVVDEPFYAQYLERTGADHPYREEILDQLPNETGAIVDWMKKDATAKTPIRFSKVIAYHVAPDDPVEWVDQFNAFLLIRDPRAMIASYRKKFADVAPILDSARVQRRVYERRKATGLACPIVDATDILKAPKQMLAVLCEALEIPFDAAMLSWPAGPRQGDGVWGPHWYDAVLQTTGFKPYAPRDITLSPELEAFADDCMADYRFFFEKRLTG